MRTLQYFARFYSWYLYRLNGTPAEIAPWNAVKTQFGLIRKSLRLGKFIEHFKAAAQAYDTKTGPGGGMDPFLRYCAIGRQLGYAGYMLFDNVHFLHVSGIRKLEQAKRWQENAYRWWFVGLAFNSVAGFYQLWLLRQRQARLDKKEGEDVVESKRLERYLTQPELPLLVILKEVPQCTNNPCL